VHALATPGLHGESTGHLRGPLFLGGGVKRISESRNGRENCRGGFCGNDRLYCLNPIAISRERKFCSLSGGKKRRKSVNKFLRDLRRYGGKGESVRKKGKGVARYQEKHIRTNLGKKGAKQLVGRDCIYRV